MASRTSTTSTPPLAPSTAPVGFGAATSTMAGLASASASTSPLLGAQWQGLQDLDRGIQTLIHLHRIADITTTFATTASAATGGGGSGAGLSPPPMLSLSMPASNGSRHGLSQQPFLLYPATTTSAMPIMVGGSILSSSSGGGGGVHRYGPGGGFPHGSPAVRPASTTSPGTSWFLDPTPTPGASGTGGSNNSSSHTVLDLSVRSSTGAFATAAAGESANSTSNNAGGSSTQHKPSTHVGGRAAGATSSPPAMVAGHAGRGGGDGPHGSGESAGSAYWSGNKGAPCSPSLLPRQEGLQSLAEFFPCLPGPPLSPPPLDLSPPYRFATVEDGVYRGAYPVLRNFPFLRTLKLKTIVQLTPEEPTFDLATFAAASGIEVIHIQAERFKGEAQLLPEDLGLALKTLINVEKHPVYLHCLDGRQVSGLVIMALRKLMHWDIAPNHFEYRRFAKSVDDEVAFITDYNGPVEVPLRIPKWLWGGVWADAHGNPKPRLHNHVKLKFPAVPVAAAAAAARTATTGTAAAAAPTTTSPFASAPLQKVSSASGVSGPGGGGPSLPFRLPPPAGLSSAAAAAMAGPSRTPPSHGLPATTTTTTAQPFDTSSSSSITARQGGSTHNNNADGSRLGTPAPGPTLTNSPFGSSSSSLVAAVAGSAPAPGSLLGTSASRSAIVPPPQPKPVYIDVADIAPLPLWGPEASSISSGSITSTTASSRKRGGTARAGAGEGEPLAYTARDSTNTSVAASTMAPASVERERGSGGASSSAASNADSDTPLWLRRSTDSVAGLQTNPRAGPRLGGSSSQANARTYDNLSTAAAILPGGGGGSGGVLPSPHAPTRAGSTVGSSLASVPAGAASAGHPAMTLLTVPALAPSPQLSHPQQQQDRSGGGMENEGGGSRKIKRRASL